MYKCYMNKFVNVDHQGDCFNACVASLLDLPLTKVSDILPLSKGDYHERWRLWFAHKGLKQVVYFPDEDVPGYSIATITTDRIYPDTHRKAGRPIHHAVIAFNKTIIHDPYPLGSEVKTIECYKRLEPMTCEERKLHELRMGTDGDGECIHGYRYLCSDCGPPKIMG